jgi:hypothetical protein
MGEFENYLTLKSLASLEEDCLISFSFDLDLHSMFICSLSVRKEQKIVTGGNWL